MSYFQELVEHAMNRIEYKGYQVHDYVKITKTDLKGADDDLKSDIKEFKNSNLNLKILEIVSVEEYKDELCAVVGQEHACGLYPKKITIPVTHLQVIGYNMPPSIPDEWKTANKSDASGEPEGVKATSDYSKYLKTTDAIK